MMRQTSMRTKLLVCFSFVVLVSTAAAVCSLSTVRRLRAQMREEIVGSCSRLDQSRQITIGIANMRGAMRGVSLFGVMHQSGPFAKARSSFDSTAAEMRQTVRQMESSKLNSEDLAAANAIRSALDQWVENFQEFADMCAAGHAEEASEIVLKKTTPLMDSLQKSAAGFGQANSTRRDAAIRATEASIQRNELVVLVLAACIAGWSGGILCGGGSG